MSLEPTPVTMTHHTWSCLYDLKSNLRIMTAFDHDLQWVSIDTDADTMTARFGCYEAEGINTVEMCGPFKVFDEAEGRPRPYWQTKAFRLEDIDGMTPEQVAKYMRDGGSRCRYQSLIPPELEPKADDTHFADFAVFGRIGLDAVVGNAVAVEQRRSFNIPWDWDLMFTPAVSAALIRQRSLLGKLARYCARGAPASKTLKYSSVFAWLKELADMAIAMETR